MVAMKFHLRSWYDETERKWKAPQEFQTLLTTPWGSSDWTNRNAPVCRAMKDMWSKCNGKAALHSALEHNSNRCKTAFQNLPVEFKLALTYDFHWERYEGNQRSGYYDYQLGEAMLLYLIENFCHMAESFWEIKLAKTSDESLYLVTHIAKGRGYISTMGQLCGIWDLVREQKGWTERELTNSHTQAKVLHKAFCHMVYEIVEGNGLFHDLDLLYTTIAYIVFEVLNENPHARYDRTWVHRHFVFAKNGHPIRC